EARPGPAGPAAASNRAGLVAVRGLPVPSGPSGALHASGSWRADRCVVLKPGQVPLPSTGAAP
ncbi:hypothetical protein, partial [Corynebacterium argentoratense]|uniref:hypothetical protein n=1 Tax=Corynebacterium argentoratense TaxID=42817 RepID=UPI0028ECCF9B